MIGSDVVAAVQAAGAAGLRDDLAVPHRCRGMLRLRFSRTTHGTTLTVVAQEPPLRVVRAFPLADGATLVHLHNVSGGVLGGDHLELQVEVDANAHAQITSTSATRLYRSRSDVAVAEQRIICRIGEGALLEYLPDPLIPFAGARYRQHTVIELADNAGLFWWETVAPGRAARRELFAFELVQLHLDLTAAGALVAQERVHLEPLLRPLSSPIRLGPYRHFATFYMCRVGLPAARWLALESELAMVAGALTRPDEICWGVSTLPAHGLVVRALSVRGQDIATGLVKYWQVAKRELYGQSAILPRKIY